MNWWVALGLAVPMQVGGGAPGAPAVEVPAEVAEPEPWGGSWSEGLREIARLSEVGEHPAALELSTRMLMIPELTEAQRAEVHYAAGIVFADGGRAIEAADSFSRARALAGGGELRLDATYNGGVAWLEEGERHRLEIPEIAARATGGQAPPPAEEGEDPLQLARASYENAKQEFVARLRSDWTDADTRANLEWIQRRLRELDEIEQQREQQEQEQEDQEDQEDQQSSDEEQQDQEQESSDQEDSDQQDSEQESQDQQQDSQESEPEEPDEQDPSGDPSDEQDQDEESPRPDEPQDEREPEEEAAPEPSEAAEQHLTKEEAMRLLDRLRELEERARELKAQLQRNQRIPVERDW